MVPLYAARIEDLGPGDFIKVDCACGHTALLTPAFLARLGLSLWGNVMLDLRSRAVPRLWRARQGGLVAIQMETIYNYSSDLAFLLVTGNISRFECSGRTKNDNRL
jgi:hypothetical protein